MSEHTPRKSRRDTPAIEPQRMNVEHLRRVADSCRDLGDPTLMAKAWDEPATSDARSATNSLRRFGQLQDLSVPVTFDDSLPDAEISAWESDSPPKS
jgi:hypothetical protein